MTTRGADEITRRSEVEDILQQERLRLQAALDAAEEVSTRDLWIGADYARELRRCLELLATLSGDASTQHLSHALKRSVYARTVLMRHTPAIRGWPAALDPTQTKTTEAGREDRYLIDYARSGSQLSLLDDGTLAAVDHPILELLANHVSAVVHPAATPRSLLFSSATAAMNEALDWMLHQARQQNKRVLVGAHSWMEVLSYLHDHGDGVVELIDETDSDALQAALLQPDVFGISIETIVNHPRLPVVELTRVFEGVRDRVVLLDCAHTPEVDPRRAFGAAFDDLCVMTVVSGVKFLQAGLDLAAGGLLSFWHERPYEPVLARRERSGRVPSYVDAWLSAIETSDSFTSRLARYDNNMQKSVARLQTVPGLKVVSAWSPEHPKHHTALDLYGTGGRFAYLSHEAMTSAGAVVAWERAVLKATEQASLPLVSACTFGLAVCHINVIAHPTQGPVLRWSSGSAPYPEVEAVVDTLVNCLARLAATPP